MLTARLCFASLSVAAAILVTAVSAQTVSTSLPAGSYSGYSGPPATVTPSFHDNSIPHDPLGGLLQGNYTPTAGIGPIYLPPCPPILGDPPDTGLPNPKSRPLRPVLVAPNIISGPTNGSITAVLPFWKNEPRLMRWEAHNNYPRRVLGHTGTPYFMAFGQLMQSMWKPSAKRLKPIEASFALRRELFEELHSLLEALRTAAPDEQARRLGELAATQEPKLRELETGAEAIRTDLTTSGFVKVAAADPSTWPLDLSAPLRRALLAFSAAHFHDGFSPDQRALLEEMGMEAWLTDGSTPPADAVFFWPAGARVRFPSPLPAALAAQLADFQQRKAALKHALQAALDRRWGYFNDNRRTGDYTQLAASQAPAFAALDTLAEQIRRDLAALPAGQPLPQALAARAADLVARRAALQREFYGRLGEFRAELPTEIIKVVERPEGLAIAISSPHGKTDTPARRATIDRMRAFSAEVSARFAALATEREAVRTALEDYRRTGSSTSATLTVDQLLATFRDAAQARASEDRQLDYYAAAFLPGLSPAQRRLLFAGVRVSFLREISEMADAP